MLATIERFFKLKENNTTIKTECIAGTTTFMTMCYIIFVEPAVLQNTGMNFGSVMVATCISSFIATLLMGLLANYPISLAAAMGHNFYFTYTVCGSAAIGGLEFGWQGALAAVFLAGVIYLILTLIGVREKLLNMVPTPLKYGIASGIGLFIAFIGLQWAGLVIASPGTLVKLGEIHEPAVLLSALGILLIAGLMARKVQGAILISIAIVTIIGMLSGIVKFYGIAAMPPSIEPTFFKLDFHSLFSHPNFLDVVFVFLFLNLFDTIGTLLGVAQQGNFLDEEGKLPRADKALQADSMSAVIGSTLGCSTVTSYVESAAGVVAGARTGLANMFTASLFLLAIFFYPLVKCVGEGYKLTDGTIIYPIVAPALVIVGSLMMKNIKELDWEKISDSVPAFLAAIAMPFTFSITEGISWGFISYVILKLLAGKGKTVNWLVYVFAVIFILRYIFLVT